VKPAPLTSSVEEDAEHIREILTAIGRQRSLRDPFSTMCEEKDLSPAQLHCVGWLGTDGALSMGDLSRRLGITEKTITGIVDRLEAAGHVRRERDAADRRVVRVKLTESGAVLYQRVNTEFVSGLGEFLGVLDADDRSTFIRILDTFRNRLATPSDPAIREGK
jgi:DNA-binding MarR family transcriptional regulator